MGNTKKKISSKSAPKFQRPKLSHPCPCESGRTFKQCCAKQKIEWMCDSKGVWHKVIPIHPEVEKILQRERAEFKELFGRSPRKDEIIFFRLNALSSPDEIERQISVALDKAEIRPEIAYAIRKTGLMLSEESSHLATGKDLDDWDAAIEEYWSGKADEEELEDAELVNFMAVALKEYERATIVLGSVSKIGGPYRKDADEYAISHLMFCITRTLRTLRALRLLTDEHFGEDGMTLVRSAFEGYLHIAYMLGDLSRAEHLFWARLGLLIGTHEHMVRENGRTDWTKIVEKTSGKILTGSVTYREMARLSFQSEDIALYDDLYGFLSTHSHPDAINFTHYVNEGTFDHTNSSMYFEARVYGLFVAFFMIDAVCESNLFSKRFHQDLARYRSRRQKILLNMLGPAFPSGLRQSFQSRVEVACSERGKMAVEPD